MSARPTNGLAWLVLLASAVLEAVWATALDASRGFTVLGDTVVFVVALAASMLGLGLAAKRIPIGTAYAIWTGVGAALTVTWAMVTGSESASALKVLFLLGIIGCAIGLKVVGHDGHDGHDKEEPGERAVSGGAPPAPPPGHEA